MRKHICMALFAATSAMAMAAQPVSLRIAGEVDSSYTSLSIRRHSESIRSESATIPVVSGKVDYVFTTAEPDRFEIDAKQDLYSKGTLCPLRFMAEDGEIIISGAIEDGLLRMQIDSATGPLNNERVAYLCHASQTYDARRDSITAVMEQTPWDDYYTPEAKAFWEEFDALMAQVNEHPDSLPLLERSNEMYRQRDQMEADRTMYTAEYYALHDAYVNLSHEQFEDDMAAYGTADGGFFALSVLMDHFGNDWFGADDKERIIASYLAHYHEPYASTAMGRRMSRLINGYELSHVGGRYPDFTLPDADGNEHHIKALIGGKLALVDLWGSSCGPCRVNSRSMKPIYADYKDKGFEIVGIAREYGNLDYFRHELEQDGYPWMQLIELDDAHGIFDIHGIPNAMGGTFLVSPEGRVLLINPSPDELRKFLADYYAK